MANANDRHIFVNAGAIAHFSTGDIHQPLVGLAMSSSEQIHPPGHGFVVEGGQFTKIAPTEEIMDEYGFDAEVHDFEGRAITPGFVDAHTHLLWDGDRSNEIRMRQQGMSYSDIAAAGGGIRHTVSQTRGSQSLRILGDDRRNVALMHGTTSIEVKSGYGLDTGSELTLLKIYGEMQNDVNTPQLYPTWMGAHDIPHGLKREEYVEQILSEQLPAIIEQGIAIAADVF
ncbi:MAG: hypothetical protein VX230_02660, partial [Candidatus Thermoplasmatota archaeon]|nr:hypothetical protein [Candidatus Thermoplasmatota archaeon]